MSAPLRNMLKLSRIDYNAFLEIINHLDTKSLYELCKSDNPLIEDMCKTEPYISRLNRYKDILERRKKYERYYHDMLYELFTSSDIPTQLYLYYYYYLTEQNIEKLPENYTKINKEEINEIISGLFYKHQNANDIVNYFSEQYSTYVEYAQDFYNDIYGTLDIYFIIEDVTNMYYYEQQEDLVTFIDIVISNLKPSWLYDSKDMLDPSLRTYGTRFIYKDNIYEYYDIQELLDEASQITSLYFE